MDANDRGTCTCDFTNGLSEPVLQAMEVGYPPRVQSQRDEQFSILTYLNTSRHLIFSTAALEFLDKVTQLAVNKRSALTSGMSGGFGLGC